MTKKRTAPRRRPGRKPTGRVAIVRSLTFPPATFAKMERLRGTTPRSQWVSRLIEENAESIHPESKPNNHG